MNIVCSSNGFIKGNSVVRFYHLPGQVDDVLTRAQMERQYGSESDPEKPPRRKPGDRYIIVGAVVGLVAGGGLGSFGGLFAIFGGGIVGALIGSLIGNLVRKRRK